MSRREACASNVVTIVTASFTQPNIAMNFPCSKHQQQILLSLTNSHDYIYLRIYTWLTVQKHCQMLLTCTMTGSSLELDLGMKNANWATTSLVAASTTAAAETQVRPADAEDLQLCCRL